jgi:hypothetical protein
MAFTAYCPRFGYRSSNAQGTHTRRPPSAYGRSARISVPQYVQLGLSLTVASSWNRRDSNSRFCGASTASSRWTTTPLY